MLLEEGIWIMGATRSKHPTSLGCYTAYRMFYIVLNVSIQSFVCLLLSSLYYFFGVVDCAFKHNKGNAVNPTQHLNGSNS